MWTFALLFFSLVSGARLGRVPLELFTLPVPAVSFEEAPERVPILGSSLRLVVSSVVPPNTTLICSPPFGASSLNGMADGPARRALWELSDEVDAGRMRAADWFAAGLLLARAGVAGAAEAGAAGRYWLGFERDGRQFAWSREEVEQDLHFPVPDLSARGGEAGWGAVHSVLKRHLAPASAAARSALTLSAFLSAKSEVRARWFETSAAAGGGGPLAEDALGWGGVEMFPGIDLLRHERTSLPAPRFVVRDGVACLVSTRTYRPGDEVGLARQVRALPAFLSLHGYLPPLKDGDVVIVVVSRSEVNVREAEASGYYVAADRDHWQVAVRPSFPLELMAFARVVALGVGPKPVAQAVAKRCFCRGPVNFALCGVTRTNESKALKWVAQLLRGYAAKKPTTLDQDRALDGSVLTPRKQMALDYRIRLKQVLKDAILAVEEALVEDSLAWDMIKARKAAGKKDEV